MGRLDEQHDNKPWHMEHIDEHGHRHVTFGTKQIDMIRTLYEGVIEAYSLAQTLKFTINDAGEGFVRMTFDYRKVRRWKATHQLQEDLDAAITGQDWGTCRGRGYYDEKTNTEWSVARHNGGPLL
jgi:hypothetical protein